MTSFLIFLLGCICGFIFAMLLGYLASRSLQEGAELVPQEGSMQIEVDELAALVAERIEQRKFEESAKTAMSA